MKGYTTFTLSLLLSSLFLSGCGSSSSSPSISSGTSPSSPTTELEGSWRKPCSPADPMDPNTHHDIIILTFTGNEFFSDIENYEDSGCLVPLSFSANPTASGTFALGDLFTATDGTQARELNSHIDIFDGAPFTIDDYGIYRIDTDILYLEEDDDIYDGSTAALRSHTLDYTKPFYRQ